MDGEKFDDLIKRFCTTRLTRMSALRGLVAGAAAALTGSVLALDETEAQKKKKKGGGKKRSAKKVGPVKKKGKKRGRQTGNRSSRQNVRAQTHVAPKPAPNDNPTCDEIDESFNEIKVESPSGTGTSEFCTGTGDDQCCCTIGWEISGDDEQFLEFGPVDGKKACLVDVVIVKGGDQGAQYYDYRPDGAESDSGLTTPTEQEISHFQFCGISCPDCETAADCTATPPICKENICTPDGECEFGNATTDSRCQLPSPNVCQQAVCGTDKADGTWKCLTQSANNGAACGEQPAPVCQQRVCRNGSCKLENLTKDSRCQLSAPNDCQVAVCGNDASSNTWTCIAQARPEDTPCDDITVPACQKSVCGGGTQAGQCILKTDPNQEGKTCGAAPDVCEKRVCRTGTCTEEPDDNNFAGCPPPGACKTRACTAGLCDPDPDLNEVGKLCDPGTTIPDCKTAICGAGADAGKCLVVADASQDGDDCTLANPGPCIFGLCASGVCESNNKAEETECTTSGVDDGVCCVPDDPDDAPGICVSDQCRECTAFSYATCACEGTEGCTLTQGYWKNHTEDWPTGDGVPTPETDFFDSGKTWIQALEASSKDGNGYYALAQQYIAAVLNVASGACVPQEVEDAIAEAAGLFTGAGGSFGKSQKADVTRLIGILDAYNNGVTGPGHCDD